ncbi:MAG: adenylate/guanylate cyclase domain-containing protein [Myxococcota bacterium]|nr:adenylate/guanylate cyclase domain-containing protein [Myxococcota bacterium]
MKTHFDDIVDWLIATADEHRDLRSLTDKLVSRLREAGVAIQRINLGVFALHPEMAGYAVVWDEGMGDAIEVPVRREDTLKPLYLASPIRLLVESRKPAHFDMEDPRVGSQHPIIGEFREQGYTHYLGFPIPYGDDGIAVLTVCTKRPGGFSPEEVGGIEGLFPVLRLLIRIVETRRLAKTILQTYLGPHIGERVLAGEMLRGQGETVQAALWLCDLRGFTSMTSALGSFAIIDVMNQYFDCMAEAIWAQQGEILKFIGDAMLVVFRIRDETSAGDAARQAVCAAQDALQRLDDLSNLRVEEGLLPLRAGVAVHLGTVVYGNIGASRRLDFTVMGEAVNLVARIQDVTGETEEALLFSKEIAELLAETSESLGVYDLKGVSDPVELFKPAAGHGLP